MCLILVAWHGHPQYPLFIAANRDEFHARPAAPADWWQDEPRILAGLDLRAGQPGAGQPRAGQPKARGTWLGLTRDGRFAALTNFRGAPQRMDADSRRTLVAELLRSRDTAALILDHLRRVGPNYNAFNVIFSDGDTIISRDAIGEARFEEWTWNPDGSPESVRNFAFRIHTRR